jgi:hypothetical protein
MNIMDDAGETENEGKNTLPPPGKTQSRSMPSPHAMHQANSELKEKLDNLVVTEKSEESANYRRGWDGKARESAIKRLELSDSNSNRIAHDILSSEPEKNGYFDHVSDEITESENWVKGTRKKSISNLSSDDIVSKLMLKDEKLSTSTVLKVKSCEKDGVLMGYNMDFLLTDKRLIIVDNDEDIVNTISGQYKGSFPKSAELKIESRNYLNIFFQPFRLGDVTDINFNFKYGSETHKTMSRGWPTVVIISAWLIFTSLISPVIGMIIDDYVIGFLMALILSIFIPIIMLLFPIKWATKKNPVYLTNIRQINIRLVNKYTKVSSLIRVEVDDEQTINSILDWVEKLQSTSSMTD